MNYNKYPVTKIESETTQAWQGWDKILCQLRATLAGKPRKCVLAVETYPSVDDAELTAALQRLNPALWLDTTDALLPKEEYHARIAPFLTEDRVFGRMYYGTLADFQVAEKLGALRAQAENANGLVIVYGLGAADLTRPDVLVYADMARWEIQQRFRRGAPNYYSDNGNDDNLKKFKQGRNIPTEQELQELYGVSRITVRQAILALEQEGMVTRARGKGTIVSRRPKIRETLSRIQSFTTEMRERGMTPGTAWAQVEKVPADEALAGLFAVPEGTELTHLRRVRTANRKPIVLFESWLSVPGLPGDRERYISSLYALLESVGAAPPAGIEEQFEATLAEGDVAEALGIQSGTPVMKRTRKGFNRDGQVQEYTVGWYDGRNYSTTITTGITEQEEQQ